MTTNEVIDGLIRTPIESNLLRFAAGHNIFCPACGDVMDWRKTTIATIYGVPKGKTAEEIVRQFCSCSECWDKRKVAFYEGVAKSTAKLPECKIRTEIVDGRESRFDDLD